MGKVSALKFDLSRTGTISPDISGIRPTSFRKALHKSKKIYDRKKLKKLI